MVAWRSGEVAKTQNVAFVSKKEETEKKRQRKN